MLRAAATWWDSVELWLTQLAFPVQVVLVVAVIGPACWGVAAVIDRLVERSVAAQLEAAQRRREAQVDQNPAGEPVHDGAHGSDQDDAHDPAHDAVREPAP